MMKLNKKGYIVLVGLFTIIVVGFYSWSYFVTRSLSSKFGFNDHRVEREIARNKDFLEAYVYNPLYPANNACAMNTYYTPPVCLPVNNDGMISDRDFPVPKPPGIRRIALLGDSFAAGYGLTAEDTLWFNLQKKLPDTVEVLNFSFFGSSISTQAENFFHNNKGPKYQPDVIIIRYQWNDIYPLTIKYFEVRYFRYIEKHYGFLPRKMKNKLLSIWTRYMRGVFEHDFQKNPRTYTKTQLIDPINRLDKYANKNGIAIVVVSDYCELVHNVNKDEFISEYEILSKLKTKKNWYYHDLCKTNINFKNPQMFLLDGHPSKLSNQLVASEIRNFIKRELLF